MRLLRRGPSTQGWGGRLSIHRDWGWRGRVQHKARGGGGGGSTDPNSRGQLCLLVESGTVVPLLTGAVAAPWRPSHTGMQRGGGGGDIPRRGVAISFKSSGGVINPQETKSHIKDFPLN